MKRQLLRWVYAVAFYSGVISLFYFLNRRQQIVLTYHNVLPDSVFDDSLHLGVSHSATSFERQMEIIARRWPNPERNSCLITFDDGYLNLSEVAAPILHKHERRAVFFVALDLILNRRILWPDRLMRWISYVPPGDYDLGEKVLVLSGKASRFAAWASVWNLIIEDYGRLGAISAAMNAAYPFDRLPVSVAMERLRFEPLSADQVGSLGKMGHSIGCHSFGHDILACLPDELLREDFNACERHMNTIFNCDFYSYPFGGIREVSQREMSVCRGSRFRQAFMNVDSGGISDKHAQPRTSLPNTTDRYLIEAKLSGFEAFLKRLTKSLSRLR